MAWTSKVNPPLDEYEVKPATRGARNYSELSKRNKRVLAAMRSVHFARIEGVTRKKMKRIK
jgi:hypothetical protein